MKMRGEIINMVNEILKVFLLILLAPFLWVYFGFKILKSKEQRNRNNILISAISFILFIVMISSSGNSNISNGINSSSNVADNNAMKVESEIITTDVIETTDMETDIIETTTITTAATTEIEISETTTVETTVPETTMPSSVVTETVMPETVAPEVTEQLVWITRTGSKYHSINNCGNTNPNNAYQMSLSDAQTAGYEPCKRCYK